MNDVMDAAAILAVELENVIPFKLSDSERQLIINGIVVAVNGVTSSIMKGRNNELVQSV